MLYVSYRCVRYCPVAFSWIKKKEHGRSEYSCHVRIWRHRNYWSCIHTSAISVMTTSCVKLGECTLQPSRMRLATPIILPTLPPYEKSKGDWSPKYSLGLWGRSEACYFFWCGTKFFACANKVHPSVWTKELCWTPNGSESSQRIYKTWCRQRLYYLHMDCSCFQTSKHDNPVLTFLKTSPGMTSTDRPWSKDIQYNLWEWR